MSDSDSDSESDLISVKSSDSNDHHSAKKPDFVKEEDDDLFADVFAGDESIDKLTSIVEKARVPLSGSTVKSPLLLDTSCEERKRLSDVFKEDPIVLNVLPSKPIQDHSSTSIA